MAGAKAACRGDPSGQSPLRSALDAPNNYLSVGQVRGAFLQRLGFLIFFSASSASAD